LNDLDHAVAQQELAVTLNPGNAAWWATLADLYQTQGQADKSAQAREKAASIQNAAAGVMKPPAPGPSH
jgi:Tfp pilus assembly protein PilF